MAGLGGAIIVPSQSAVLGMGVDALILSFIVVVVGGLGSLHGAILGAGFVALLPVLISEARDVAPVWAGTLASVFGKNAGTTVLHGMDRFVKQPGLEPGIFGLILVLFILFEPLGLYGRWLKIKLYFSLFPLYKRATFRRQKAYMRSERLR
jgi:branched-chain amino acid transport system permease protein